MSRNLSHTIPGRVLVILFSLTVTSCMNVGPASIQAGRLSYIEAISTTNEQQILLSILHNRYNQHGALLAVKSITANIRVAASSSVQAGFGDNDDYRGNLVPFGAGVQYEENPIISYAPVDGEKHMRQTMSPIPVSRLAILAGSLNQPAYVYETTIASVNGLKNPAFETGGPSSSGYSRFVQIMTSLEASGSLEWLLNKNRQTSIVIERSNSEVEAMARELLALLGIDDPSPGAGLLVIPARASIDGRPDNVAGFKMRSIWDLIEIFSASVELPESDNQAGVATDYPRRAGQAARISVKYASERPAQPSLAVPYRDGWFFISDNDLYTKRVFRLLGALWNGTMAESSNNATPVLTVPVSR